MANHVLKRLTYDGKPIIAEAAYRDSYGNLIVTTYSQIGHDHPEYLRKDGGEQYPVIGELYVYGGIQIGEYMPYYGDGFNVVLGKDLTFLNTASAATGFYVNSSKTDILAYADKKNGWEITCNYRGDGSEESKSGRDDSMWVAYPGNNTELGYSWELASMFDNSFTSGAIFPVGNLSTNPLVITIKTTGSSIIDYTDTNYLVLNGWRFNGQPEQYDHYGRLTNYSVDVMYEKIGDTEYWTNVLNRNNVDDPVSEICIPLWSSLASSSGYNQFYGVRITIRGAIAGGSGCVGFTNIRIMEHRPKGKPSDSVSALSQDGGTIYGEIKMGDKFGCGIVPAYDNGSYIGSANNKFGSIHSLNFYENGEPLSNKYIKGKSMHITDAVSFNNALVEVKHGSFTVTDAGMCIVSIVVRAKQALTIDGQHIGVIHSEYLPKSYLFGMCSSLENGMQFCRIDTDGTIRIIADGAQGGNWQWKTINFTYPII